MSSPWRRRWAMRVGIASLSAAALLAGCQAEQRPGTVETIGTPKTGSVSASVSAPPAFSPASLNKGNIDGMVIPVGLTPTTSGPTKSDGIYTPTSNREIYQKISTDYQEIVALTNRVTEGKPLPAAEILLLYEAGKHTRIGTSSRSLRIFAREAARSQEFPDAVAFYKSPTFLDDPVNDAIVGARTAADYTPAQRRQAIQKGILRIIYHWSRRYIQSGAANLNPGLVDEAWAIYVGEEKDGKYPNSLAATAVSREENFNRSGSIDVPLRQAMSRAQKAAAEKDAAGYEAAARDIYSRFHTIFYLSTARYLNEALKSAQANKLEDAKAQMVEGLSYYQSIQPQVAKADPDADKAIVAYFTADPTKLTREARDQALEALNRTANALLLKSSDLVIPAIFQ